MGQAEKKLKENNWKLEQNPGNTFPMRKNRKPEFSKIVIGVWIDTYVFYQSVLQKKDLNLVIVCHKDLTS